MMKISRLADYATVLLATLALSQTRLPTAELARRTRVGIPTVRKLMKRLLEAGLVFSEQGVQGGYGLARPALEISVAEMVSAIDGSIALTECTKDKVYCDRLQSCDMAARWREIHAELQGVLTRFTLQDLLPTSEVSLKPLSFYPMKKNKEKRHDKEKV